MKTILAATLITAAVFLSGCATSAYRPPPPDVATPPPALTLDQIKEMTARGVSDETILSALRASRAVYKLTSKDVTELQEVHVSPSVIDYLLATPQAQSAPRRPRYRYYYYAYPPRAYHDRYWHFDWHHDFHHGGHHGHH